MSETAIVEAIRKEIKRRGGKSIKISGSPYMEVGTPDIVACYKGYFGVIECKKAGGKATEIQYKRLSEWDSAHAFALIAMDVETVQREYLDIVDKLPLWKDIDSSVHS